MYELRTFGRRLQGYLFSLFSGILGCFVCRLDLLGFHAVFCTEQLKYCSFQNRFYFCKKWSGKNLVHVSPPFGVKSQKKNKEGFVHFGILQKEESRYSDQIFSDDRGVLGAV